MRKFELPVTELSAVPTKNERLAAALIYLVGYFGPIGFGFLVAIGLLENITDIPELVRLHYRQSISNGIILATPAILILFGLMLVDTRLTHLSDRVIVSGLTLSAAFIVALIVVDLYGIVQAGRGRVKHLLPSIY